MTPEVVFATLLSVFTTVKDFAEPVALVLLCAALVKYLRG
jgi:hypothetical protein